jgi:hypothetical protein
MKEKIVEILKQRVHKIITDDLISPLFWDDFAEEIDQLTREHYLKFAEWVAKDVRPDEHFVNKFEILSTGQYRLTFDDIYQYWLDNVLNK